MSVDYPLLFFFSSERSLGIQSLNYYFSYTDDIGRLFILFVVKTVKINLPLCNCLPIVWDLLRLQCLVCKRLAYLELLFRASKCEKQASDCAKLSGVL